MEAEREGVIKYRLEFESADLADTLDIRELNRVRDRLVGLAVMGQDPARYGGLGFGNISERLDGKRFLISGSQTGHLARLSLDDFALVTECDPVCNRLVATGRTPPSSESLSHGVIYLTKPAVNAVLHVHDPLVWRCAGALGLPATAATIPYGTPEMASAIRTMMEREFAGLEQGIFVMNGHEDGVVAFGVRLDDALQTLLKQQALARLGA